MNVSSAVLTAHAPIERTQGLQIRVHKRKPRCCPWAQVVAETYEELVFSEPSKQFYERAKGLEPEKAPRPELSVLSVVSPPTPQEELDRLNAARRQIAISTAKAQKQMAALIAA